MKYIIDNGERVLYNPDKVNEGVYYQLELRKGVYIVYEPDTDKAYLDIDEPHTIPIDTEYMLKRLVIILG